MVIKNISHFDPLVICESGQCFRMRAIPGGFTEAIYQDKALLIERLGEGQFAFHCSQAEFEAIWREYFDLDTDYAAFINAADPADGYLTSAVASGSGLRILNQDPWETLVSFLLSQRKSIPAIRDGIEKLCHRFGEPFAYSGRLEYAFPSPQKLAQAEMEELRACSLGYRAPYIQATARSVASGETDLGAMRQWDDTALLEKLLSLHGVGIKVASCVMLFGYHRLDLAPVDVWIQRVIDKEYNGEAPFHKYKGFAGVMQQYMFYDQMLKKRLQRGIA